MSEKWSNTQIADAFLDAISSDDVSVFSQVCAEDMVIWHNVGREERLFSGYIEQLMSVRRLAGHWKYTVVRHIETEDGFIRRLLVEGSDLGGQSFVAATCMFVTVKDARIARIYEYYNSADVAPLFEAAAA